MRKDINRVISLQRTGTGHLIMVQSEDEHVAHSDEEHEIGEHPMKHQLTNCTPDLVAGCRFIRSAVGNRTSSSPLVALQSDGNVGWGMQYKLHHVHCMHCQGGETQQDNDIDCATPNVHHRDERFRKPKRPQNKKCPKDHSNKSHAYNARKTHNSFPFMPLHDISKLQAAAPCSLHHLDN